MSLARLHEHRRIWKAKPVLEQVYAVWFEQILGLVPHRARVFELGAGPGLFAPWARRRRPDVSWIASDLDPAPWNELAADASRLPLRDGSVDVVAGVDLLHHVARPRDLFAEAARALKPSGRLVLIEPWVTPLSFPVYRWLHQEGCRLSLDPWNPFGQAEGKDPFEGDAAGLWRIARATAPADWEQLGLELRQLRPLNGFAYMASLGFREASLVGARGARWLNRLDRLARGASRLLGLRALAVWQRRAAANAQTGA